MSELLIHRAKNFGDRIALISGGRSHTYVELLSASMSVASSLLRDIGGSDSKCVALLCRANPLYVFGQWGIWRAGGMVLPLCPEHPPAEMLYLLSDSGASILLVERFFADRVAALVQDRPIHVIWLDDAVQSPEVGLLPTIAPGDRAMMLYTSGTTSRPKGVVTTHANIAVQISSLVEAWEWSSTDRILNFLPLHHIHGVINVIGCALWSGATCEMLDRFDLDSVFSRVISRELTLFMAVPTIYSRLIDGWDAADSVKREQLKQGFGKMRLMVCGSAALPVRILERWREITDHTLLERYGMTETGMILSNPLHGQRIPGSVGKPLPGIKVRLVSEDGIEVRSGDPGEIQVRGVGVFNGYWNRPDANSEAFVNGWFRTGDIAVCMDGVYRILGRQSIDIIKTGGYKVSAIEIEEVLREHPDIAQCAVVGVADDEWGQRVAAAVVLRDGRTMSLSDLRAWAKQRLSTYKAPTLLQVLDELPRNAMGKVVKPQLAGLFKVV